MHFLVAKRMKESIGNDVRILLLLQAPKETIQPFLLCWPHQVRMELEVELMIEESRINFRELFGFIRAGKWNGFQGRWTLECIFPCCHWLREERREKKREINKHGKRKNANGMKEWLFKNNVMFSCIFNTPLCQNQSPKSK